MNAINLRSAPDRNRLDTTGARKDEVVAFPVESASPARYPGNCFTVVHNILPAYFAYCEQLRFFDAMIDTPHDDRYDGGCND
jgi:hypothetical protein